MLRTLAWTILVLIPLGTLAQKPDVVLTTGHLDQINSIDFSSDGEWMATGSIDKLIKITELSSGKELRTFAGNDGRAAFVRFTPDNDHVAALFDHGEIKIWDIASGELTARFPSNDGVTGFDFCLEDEYIAFINENDQLVVSRLDGSEVRTVVDGYVWRTKVSVEGTSVFALDSKGGLLKFDLETGDTLNYVSLFDELFYSPSRMQVSPDGDLLAIAFDDHDIWLFNTSDLSLKGKLKGHDARIWAMDFASKENILVSSDHNSNIIVWNVDKEKIDEQHELTTFAPFALRIHPNQKFFLVGDGKEIHYVRLENGKILKTYRARGNKVQNMDYHGKLIAAATHDVKIKVWDLERGKILHSLMGFWPVAFTPDGDRMISMATATSMNIWDPLSGKKIASLPTDNELIQNINISDDGKWMSGAGFYGILKLWNLEEGTLVRRMTGHAGGIYGTDISSDNKWIASAGMDGSFRIWDLTSGDQLHLQEKAHEVIASDVQFSPDGKYLATCGWDKKVHVWKTGTWEKVRTLEGHTNSILSLDWHPNSRFLATSAGNNAVSEADNSVRVWDVETGEVICHYQGHMNNVQKVLFMDDGTKAASCGDDGAIRIWDFEECSEVASLLSVNTTDHIIVTPERYYSASKDALKAVSFRMGDKIYPFEMYDLWLNRPDIVMGSIGRSSEGLINAYYYVYKKRLKRMGYTEDDVGGDFHLPELLLEKKDIPLITQDSLIRLPVVVADERYKLDRIMVYVNNVPLYASNGIDLSEEQEKSLQYTVPIRLLPGENQVQVSVLNEKGAESLRQSFSVIRDVERTGNRLFLVTIGVSEYADEEFNLQYAAKDARDIATTISQASGIYEEVNHLSLLNEEVTLEALEKVKEFLSQAEPEDIVILFIAGHGLLDESFNYYFAPHDIDFNDPSARGIPYEVLEALLTGTRSMKKLLFMDTCHSGEVDKEEVEVMKEVEVEVEDVEFRNAGVGIREKNAFGFGNSIDLMNNLFADVSNGTGATVIASSGGAEFAMESDEWQNGLFTYCLLQGMSGLKADKDYNRQITLSELRSYVYNKVQTMSNGLQRPTSREDNISLDFRVW